MAADSIGLCFIHSALESCGSKSIKAVFALELAAKQARFVAIVLFPEPPFGFIISILLAIDFSFEGDFHPLTLVYIDC